MVVVVADNREVQEQDRAGQFIDQHAGTRPNVSDTFIERSNVVLLIIPSGEFAPEVVLLSRRRQAAKMMVAVGSPLSSACALPRVSAASWERGTPSLGSRSITMFARSSNRLAMAGSCRVRRLSRRIAGRPLQPDVQRDVPMAKTCHAVPLRLNAIPLRRSVHDRAIDEFQRGPQ